jgi:hypothetical protein
MHAKNECAYTILTTPPSSFNISSYYPHWPKTKLHLICYSLSSFCWKMSHDLLQKLETHVLIIESENFLPKPLVWFIKLGNGKVMRSMLLEATKATFVVDTLVVVNNLHCAHDNTWFNSTLLCILKSMCVPLPYITLLSSHYLAYVALS